MKKNLLILSALFFFAGTMTSCSKRCKGGGWYGNRNLGYAPMEKKTPQTSTDNVATVCELVREENCEVIAD